MVNKHILILSILWLGMITGCDFSKTDYVQDISTYISPKGTDIYKPDSASIAQQYEIPEWFKNAKLGIFIHWGVYSVPAFGNEWYPRHMYQKTSIVYNHHIKTYGPQTEFGYKDFIPMFKAEKFNADEWVSLFKEAGAKYIIPVAEHHDGFSMYNSRFNTWNSVQMGPGRDIVGELKEACNNYGLHFGLSSHRAENAWYYNGGLEIPSDVQDPEFRTLYGECLGHPGGQTPDCPEGAGFNDQSIKNWLKHTYELVDLYQPELFWFDWTVGKYPFRSTFYQFMAYYYNNAIDWNRGVVVNTKFGYGDNIQVFDIERGKSDTARAFPWQTDTSIGKRSWGYVKGEQNKTPNQIIDDFVDIVSKNGNLLLNIGPRADGTITEEQQTVLREIGSWLKINGEAIYDSRPWTVAAEGEVKGTAGAFTDNEETVYTAQDIRFTTKEDVLYAISLSWTDSDMTIRSISNDMVVDQVSMLGSEDNLSWEQNEEGLKVYFPEEMPSDYAHALKITFKE
jgi:alpha-L-fucosidase